MPHLIIEYSDNLSSSYDLAELAQQLNNVMVHTGIFPLAGIRVRFHPVSHYSIADGHDQNAFVAALMRIGAGRTLEERQRAGKAVFDHLCTYFEDELNAGHLAISLDMEINDAGMSFKRNGIRSRLQQTG